MKDQFLTCAEAQTILRISKSKMYRLIHKGGLPATQVGSTYRIRQSDLDQYLSANNTNCKGENK